MNLALEKGERVSTGGKGRGEIGGEVGEVTGVVADAPATDGLGKRYGTFSGWGMAAGKVVGTCVRTSMERGEIGNNRAVSSVYSWGRQSADMCQIGDNLFSPFLVISPF